MERVGDLFERTIWTSSLPAHTWLLLEELRHNKLHQLGRNQEDYLEFSRAQEVIREYRSHWMKEPETVQQAQALHVRCPTQSAVSRTMQSCFRTMLYERFGGLPWVQWYIAIGDLPDDLFRLATAYNLERVAEAGREPRTEREPHPYPKLAPRALAASQGLDLPQKKGVQHTLTEAMIARRQAKYLQSKVDLALWAWEQGSSRMTRREWNDLKRKSEEHIP